MLGMDISSLNVQQLRRLLEAARARNDEQLVEKLLAELEVRRMLSLRGGRPEPPRPEQEPIEEPDSFPPPPDLDRAPQDPVDSDDTAEEAPEQPDQRLHEPDSWWEDLRQEAELPPEPPRSFAAPLIVGAAVAAVVAVAVAGLGWWLLNVREPASVENAAVTSPPPAAAPMPAPEEPPASADQAAAALADEGALATPYPDFGGSAPSASEAAKPAAARAPARLASAGTRASRSKAAVCRTQPTAADRLLCGYPALAVQHRQMLDAYNRALDAGADQLVIDNGQARWRAARDQVTNRAELTALYKRRIRELDAAAANPDADRPPI